MDPNMLFLARTVSGIFLLVLGTGARKEMRQRGQSDLVAGAMGLPFALAGLYLLAWVCIGKRPF